jgi:hypothetical protein
VSLPSSTDGQEADDSPQGHDLQALFHRLNNQLGIVLAHAELLEAKASDAVNRDRASQIVSGALAALGTVREIRQRTERLGRLEAHFGTPTPPTTQA